MWIVPLAVRPLNLPVMLRLPLSVSPVVVGLALVLAYLSWVVIPVEERKLGEVFGDTYEQYRRHVRRWV